MMNPAIFENHEAEATPNDPQSPPSPSTIPAPENAWERLTQLQLAAQVSHQQFQTFVDGLALGQGIPQGAKLSQHPQGGWEWVMKE